jgi:hypothetical protein
MVFAIRHAAAPRGLACWKLAAPIWAQVSMEVVGIETVDAEMVSRELVIVLLDAKPE